MKRKPRNSEVDDHPEAWYDSLLERAYERYGYADDLASNALNYGRGVKEFQRMMSALHSDDEDEFWRRYAEWVQPYVDQGSGERHRLAGKQSSGRRGHYEGWYLLPHGQIVGAPHYDEKERTQATPHDLLAAVATRHAEPHHRHRTFNDVCEEVRKYFGYKSASSVKKAAKPIQWSRSRRK